MSEDLDLLAWGRSLTRARKYADFKVIYDSKDWPSMNNFGPPTVVPVPVVDSDGSIS